MTITLVVRTRRGMFFFYDLNSCSAYRMWRRCCCLGYVPLIHLRRCLRRNLPTRPGPRPAVHRPHWANKDDGRRHCHWRPLPRGRANLKKTRDEGRSQERMLDYWLLPCRDGKPDFPFFPVLPGFTRFFNCKKSLKNFFIKTIFYKKFF